MVSWLKKLFSKECDHSFDFIELLKVNDWRVSRNLHHEIWICNKCKLKQWRSGYYDDEGNPQERIPPLKGECELSLR